MAREAVVEPGVASKVGGGVGCTPEGGRTESVRCAPSQFPRGVLAPGREKTARHGAAGRLASPASSARASSSSPAASRSRPRTPSGSWPTVGGRSRSSQQAPAAPDSISPAIVVQVARLKAIPAGHHEDTAGPQEPAPRERTDRRCRELERPMAVTASAPPGARWRARPFPQRSDAARSDSCPRRRSASPIIPPGYRHHCLEASRRVAQSRRPATRSTAPTSRPSRRPHSMVSERWMPTG